MKKTLLIPIAILLTTALSLTAITAAIISSQQTIPSNGLIQINATPAPTTTPTITPTVDLEIYTDAGATIKCTNINWGTLNPGGTVTKTVYVKNTGNVPQTLSINTNSWSPELASSILTVTWNKEGYSLAAGAIVSATLTLEAASQTGSLTDFSVNIVISGTA